jgi:hypothetical protein
MTCYCAGFARLRNIMRRLRWGKSTLRFVIPAVTPAAWAKRSVPTIIPQQAPTPTPPHLQCATASLLEREGRRRTSPRGGGMEFVAALSVLPLF